MKDNEIEIVKQKVGEILTNLNDPEYLKSVVIEKLEEEVVPIMEQSYKPGEYYPVNIILNIKGASPFYLDYDEAWEMVGPDNRDYIRMQILDYFGVDMVEVNKLPREQISRDDTRRYTEEETLMATKINTNNKYIELWAVHHNNLDEPIDFQLVRTDKPMPQ